MPGSSFSVDPGETVLARLLRLLPRRVWMCLATQRLDRRLAAGEDPSGDAALEWRSGQLVSQPAREQIACGLSRVLSERPEWALLSSAIPGDARALKIAGPALEQLATAIRSRESVRSQGVALAHLLLTEPLSVLYQPRHAEQLYEAARAALFALGPDRLAAVEQKPSARMSGPYGPEPVPLPNAGSTR
jgi:hypothetical protein